MIGNVIRTQLLDEEKVLELLTGNGQLIYIA